LRKILALAVFIVAFRYSVRAQQPSVSRTSDIVISMLPTSSRDTFTISIQNAGSHPLSVDLGGGCGDQITVSSVHYRLTSIVGLLMKFDEIAAPCAGTVSYLIPDLRPGEHYQYDLNLNHTNIDPAILRVVLSSEDPWRLQAMIDGQKGIDDHRGWRLKTKYPLWRGSSVSKPIELWPPGSHPPRR
jgi:hypothetical protein